MTRFQRLMHHLIVLTRTLSTLMIDGLQYFFLCLRRQSRTCGGKPFSAQTARALPGTRHQATACHPCDPFHPGLARSLVRLAPGLGRRPTRRPLSAGIARGSGCSGAGNPEPGRPPIPADLQALIRRMARDNPTWGEERIANELLLKLGLRVSPRTVRKYMPKRVDRGRGQRATSQRWRTFVRNHAQAIVACDFCVVVTATFRLLYVFVVMEHASRRILHVNVTAHPTAAWTLQQLREAIPADHGYRFLIHDRDSIFSQQFDQQRTAPGPAGC